MNSMNLSKNKLFNLKFLKENIKKSKGLLAFFLGIVPLINTLFLAVMAISLKKEFEILDFNSVSLITYIGLYIIPLVLAVSLFGFVFKSKSVDFVLSKPISRKSIYLTNILGGIIIITIFMLLNSLIYILFGLIFSNLIIPLSIIIDYFVFFLISYIFLFIVSSLAISLAGNLMSSLVILLLITCLYPFFSVLNLYYYETNNIDTYIKCNDETCKPENYSCGQNSTCINHLEKNEYYIKGDKKIAGTFTAPFYVLNDTNHTLYNSKSLIKMLILIPIYGLIGFYAFIKRKMENNETNFKNPKIHYLVKIITLITVSFICYLIVKDAEAIGFIVSIFIILIYSSLYDLITRKEIYRFLKSSIISFLTLIILFGIFGIYDMYMDNKVEILKDLKAIEVEGITIKKDQKYLVNNTNITGAEIINSILKDTLSSDIKVNSNESYLKTKTNKGYYNLSFNINKENEQIINEIVKNEKVAYFQNYNYNKINYTGFYLKPTQQLKDLIRDTMTNIDAYNFSNNYILAVKAYNNHKFDNFYIMPNLNKELDKYIMSERNKQAITFLETNQNLYFSTSEDYIIIDYILGKNKQNFITYLKTNNNEVTENSMYIYASNSDSLTILIGDKEKFELELEKYKQSLVNDIEYQTLLENYLNDNLDYDNAEITEEKEFLEENEY